MHAEDLEHGMDAQWRMADRIHHDGSPTGSAGALREHLAAVSLGGCHPLMVVVARVDLEAVLSEYDELREYQLQMEELVRRG